MKRSNPWLTAALQFLLLLSTIAGASPWLEAHETPLPTPRRSGDVALASSSARPIFNRSVVLGGVYSADELRTVIAHDPIVAAHYRDAAIGELRPVTLTAGRAAYVSYRVNDQIYWTRERVWIKPGETVLTDGTTVIRARCGNCISDTRSGPVAEVDPAHGELDDFIVPPLARGVDGIAGEAAAPLADLLEVPFGPQIFAAAAPALPTIEIGGDNPFGGAFPSFGVPPIFIPGGSRDRDAASSAGAPPGSGMPGGIGGGDLPSPGGPGPVDVPPAPPADFLPPDAGTTTGSGPGGSTSGPSGDTTGTTGFPGCCSTTGTSGTPDDDPPTSGSPFPTTGTVTTVSTSPNPPEAPEPGMLWLMACGAIGLASRSWRRR